MRGQIREDPTGVLLCKRRFAGAQRVIQIFEGAPEDRQTDHADVIAERTRVIRPQEARCLGMMPGSILAFEDPD